MTPDEIAARLAIYDRVLAGAKCGRPAPHGMVCTNPEGHAGECRGGAGRPVAHAEVAALWSESGPALEWLDCVRALLAEVRRLTAERDDARRVCDRPGCDAAVVRRDDGGRRCGVGHDSRWVERADLDALRARVAELEEDRRWRPASERPTQYEDVEIAMRGARDIGYYFGEGVWSLGEGYDAIDADVLGWRPLGPGPVAP